MQSLQATNELDSTHEGPTINALRRAIYSRVRETSLRSTARHLGVTATGLQGFIDGAKPYRRTLDKYLAWYLTEAANLPPSKAREVALDVLLLGIPDEDQAAVRQGLIDYLATYHEQGAAATADFA